jgi:hypothetical protein
MPSLGPAGRGGARRRTRRRMNRRMGATNSMQSPQQDPQQPSNVASDPMEDLKKLGELHQAGVISDEEFEQKKKELLSKI